MRISLLPLFVLIAMSADAQTSWGVKGGINFSYVRYFLDARDFRAINPGDPAVPGGPRQKGGVSPMVRTSLGTYINCTFTKRIGLRAELLYQGQGSGKVKFEGTGVARLEKNKFDCIMVPVSLCYKIKPRLSILTGPYLSYIARFNDSFNKPPGINSIDFGCQAGVEYMLSNKLATGVTYYYGIGDVLSEHSIERLRTAQLYLAYVIK